MKEIQLPNGEIAEFPDAMSDEQISAFLRKQFPPPPREDSALQRFSQGALASFGALGDIAQGLGQGLAETSALPAGAEPTPGALMGQLTDIGVTSPEALTRSDLATTLGRQVPTSLLGAGRAGAAGAELLAGAGGGVGEFAGQAVGGDVGGLVGGIAGSLTPAGLAAGGKAAFGGAEAAAANQAARNALGGAPISLGEIGGSPLAQVIERISATLPGGGTVSRGRATKIGLAASRVAIQVRDSMQGARAITPESGGRAVRQGFDDFVTNFRSRGGQLFDNLRATSGNTQVAPTNYAQALRSMGSEAMANTASAGAFGQGSADLIEDAAARFSQDMSRSPVMSMGQLDQIRRRIGADLSDINVIGTPREGVAKQLYAAVTQDMRQAAHVSGNLRDFERANGFWKGGLKRVKALYSEVVNRGTDSKILQALETSARGGPETVRALRRSIGKQHWDTARRVVFRRMGQNTAGGGTAVNLMDDAPEFELGRFLSNWRRYAQNGGIKELMAGASTADKAAANNLTQIAKVAAGSRELIKSLPNPSGTAEKAVAGLTAAGTLGALLTPYGLAALGGAATIAGGSAGVQKVLESPRFVAWLAQSTTLPVGQLPQHLDRLNQVVADEPESRVLAEQVLSQFQPQ